MRLLLTGLTILLWRLIAASLFLPGPGLLLSAEADEAIDGIHDPPGLAVLPSQQPTHHPNNTFQFWDHFFTNIPCFLSLPNCTAIKGDPNLSLDTSKYT
jgi:hypothetical protein